MVLLRFTICSLIASGSALFGCQSLTVANGGETCHHRSFQQRRSILTTLHGGYDATVSNPHLNIQFYTLQGGMCPYAARTQIVLHELGLEFDTIEVSGMPKPDWYLNINPRGKVPAIRIPADGNTVVYESAICDEYLCDYYNAINSMDESKHQNLMPASPSVRARIRLLNDHYDTIVAPAQFTFLMNKDSDKDRELAEALHTSLEVYEDALKASGGPFFMGSKLTLADVHVVPFFLRLVVSLRHFKAYEIPRGERFSRLLQWYATCSVRESVQAVAPSEERIVEVYKTFVEMEYSFGGLNQNNKSS